MATPHADSRLPLVLDAAARLIRSRGYEGASVRQIAQAAGMLPGSLYCHFATKDELLVAVYLRGVEQITEAVLAAIEPHDDPWDRLEAACVAHLEAILRDDDYAQVVVRVRPSDAPAAEPRLVELRNRYEGLFNELLQQLPLARGTDRHALRLMLMGALNWSQTWYRPDGRFNPRGIARKFVGLLRQAQEVDA
ncbi:TetR/AcrR family transcriptional regulator [Piscinibacter sakaiensis]|uniref:TetR/AcrR family transcriptional regulator n=1 Tax=Piscinibacter sakaiensis TaxID=1547922 RepID=UPI003AAFF8ED